MEATHDQSSRPIEIGILCSSALSAFPLLLFLLHAFKLLELFYDYSNWVYRTYFLLPFLFLGAGLLSLFAGYLLRKELSNKVKTISVSLSLMGVLGFLLTWLVFFRLAAG